MRRRSGGIAKAVTGMVLAGGAFGAVLWWNAGGWKSTPKLAAAKIAAEQPITPPPVTPEARGASTQPATITTPLGSSPTSSGVTVKETTAAALTGGAAGGTAGGVAPRLAHAGPTVGVGVGGVAPGLAHVGPTVGVGVGGPWVSPSTITSASPDALTQGKTLKDEGKLVEARTLLNAAVLSGGLPVPADAEAAKLLMREINEVLVFSPQRIAGDPWVDEVTLRPGDRLTKIANDIDVPYELILKINGLADARRVRAGQRLKVVKGPFHAVVSKSRFTIDLFLGSPGGTDAMYVTTFRVGLGSNDGTPTGVWRVSPENKLKNPTYFSPRGEGVIHADDPENPLGEFWIGLMGVEGQAVGKTSYGIHGTIHPESIGKTESMGCIRLLNEDVAQVFQMLFETRSLVRVIE